MPTLAAPFTTTSESLNLDDLKALQEIKEEAGEDPETADEKADDVASLLSTSSKSTGRFRMPSLRRRVTDNKHPPSQQQQHNSQFDRDSITSSPRSVSGAERRSRRTSEAQSEDEAASLERLGITRAPSDSWGVGDEVVMGLD